MFLGLPDPDPLVRGTDPDPDPDPSTHNFSKMMCLWVNYKKKKFFFFLILEVIEERSRIRSWIRIY
jgi:hypothetical protein